MKLLSKHPAEVMVRLACTHLNMKPSELTAQIINKGCKLTYAEIIFEVAKKTNIELADICGSSVDLELIAKSVKVDTNSLETVAGQIRRLIYRADKHLSK